MLRYISQSCSWILNGKITFIDELICPRYRDIVERDMSELIYTLLTNSWKSSLILIGSIFEGLLYCFLKGNEEFLKEVSGNQNYEVRENGRLLYYLRLFRRYFGIFDLDYLPDFITSYRNIVHPNYEINQSRISISDSAVRQALMLLNRLIRDFEELQD